MPNEKAPHYTPTPEQIAAECARIRAGWTPHETERRTVVKNGHAETPLSHAWIEDE